MKAKKVMGLFAKLEAIRPISFKNYLIQIFMVLLHGVSVGLGMYTFLSLHEKPYEYGIYAPIIFILFIIYYLMFAFCMYKVESYRDKVNILLDEFEEENKCKIRIRKQKKGFEINWNPVLEGKKGKPKGKGKGEETTNNNSQTKSLAKGKVAPKQMPIVKKDPQAYDSEEISLEDKDKKK